FVGLADLRGPDVAADRPPAVATLAMEMEVGEALLIPPLVAHGFYAPEDLALVYLVTNEYDGTDELGFAWDDPAAAITWPTTRPVLSERDQRNHSLAEALTASTR
ncbi:MAG: dTDP-4-dehydrorhamnose 3,5-epimerase family protein, partial [Candidatus Limnocylindrales bacterium]